MSNIIKNDFYEKEETIFSYSYNPRPDPNVLGITHLHNSYELLFFYEGDANYLIDGNLYHLINNDLLFIKPSIYHNIAILSSRPYARIVINFHANDLPPAVLPLLEAISSFYHVAEDSPILQLLETMRSSFKLLSNEDFEQFFIHSITNILLLLAHIPNNSIIEHIETPNSIFDNILAYIDKNPEMPITLDTLSQNFFLSKSHISHLFKKRLNISAMQYINRKRISYAHSLLVLGIPPVQVAKKCSFDNYSTFYRLYKKFFGSPPQKNNNAIHK